MKETEVLSDLEFASCIEFLETLDGFLTMHHWRNSLTLLQTSTTDTSLYASSVFSC